MAKTVKVRIPVAVDPQGRYHAYGWSTGDVSGPRNHDELLEVTDTDSIGPNEAWYWLTAELPVPESVEVEAAVEAIQ
jgi:hypothetical protein